MNVDIDEELGVRLARRAERHGFESTEAYVNTVLAAFLSEIEAEGQGAGSDQRGSLERRLEDLGYL